ncbi:putative nucleotidyltransferase substrate binding domain-containing protein [Croceicoccus mobilis]|uniref:Cyclic nucleotide-binding protein n=1 Tax=Croceicoccus mobilis TaxID=1703339 RepID=A0A916Z7B2_9SPHN|nr:putative nucleotidyltransferase substrate binding domain-containing protein [Croceicoccus mobilis]GGD79552.1 cyclic nucleotide-binding protein [Croceicoccus mobilis]
MTSDSELGEIHAFLAAHPPFSRLSAQALGSLVRHTEVSYYRRGSTVTTAGDDNRFLSVVRSGAVELKLGGTDLNARLGEGESFGYPSLIRGGPAQNEVIALEDTLLYRVEKQAFLDQRRADSDFRAFFDTDEAGRLRRALEGSRRMAAGDASEALGAHGPIGSLNRRREVVTAPPAMPIAEAAKLMAEHDVSTLPIADGDMLVGIVTDKDLRRRVLAPGIDTALPLSEIMTEHPITAVEDTPVLTALVMMAERHIHHLPVTDTSGALVSVISSNDILARLGSNSLLIAKEISSASSDIEVARACSLLPGAVTGLVSAGVDADHVSRYVSTIGESAHRRILRLAEEELGPPPVPYALVCFGSLARAEQALGSDQDNGFIFPEGHQKAGRLPYFEQMAKRLTDGLDGAGYRYCPGEIMATNRLYRQSVPQWEMRFFQWIGQPDPDAILQSTIFFDMRCLAGDHSLVDELRRDVFAAASVNKIFLSFVARAAATTRVPLGFFRNFLLQDDAKEGQVLDLKTQAIAPIVDIARLHALANATPATNTLERLRAAGDAGSLDADAARDLAAAFEFVRDVRLRHQAQQVEAGEAPTNKLPPASLSRFDREHLRDAFKMIRDQLDKARSKYAGGVT